MGRIINLKEMLLFAPVAQTDISKISAGDNVIITVTGIGNRKGTVKRISSSASEATRTFSVEIEINNGDNSLKAGMSAEVGILVEKVKAFSISPAHLVIGEDGSLMVKTVKDNIVKEKVVSLVRTSGDFALISGLNDEELVLTTGQAFVNLGDKIEYKVD
jgi:multidrug efflux system membrane fusion protein